MQQKKIPQRKCLGCNAQKPKMELVRIVKEPDGNIILDVTGKKSGRGAYICPDIKCLIAAKKAKRIERALEVSVPDEIYENIETELSLRNEK